MNIYLDLFLSFLKIGVFTIGGGYAMIPIISDTTVSKGWITPEMLIDFIAIAESTPGPFAINISTFIGYDMGGLFGVFCTTMGLFLPPFLIILVVAYFADRFMKNRYVNDAFSGLRPAVVGLIGSAFLSIAVATFLPTGDNGAITFNWFGLIWAVICFVVMRRFKKIHPILIIIVSAGVGILFYGFILPS